MVKPFPNLVHKYSYVTILYYIQEDFLVLEMKYIGVNNLETSSRNAEVTFNLKN